MSRNTSAAIGIGVCIDASITLVRKTEGIISGWYVKIAIAKPGSSTVINNPISRRILMIDAYTALL